MLRVLAAGLLAGFFLAGCDTARLAVGAADAKVQEGVALVKQMNDAEARAYLAVPCAVSLGAYHRVLDESQRRAADMLCGGTGEKPVTVEDVRRARDLMNLVSPEDE